MHSHLAPNPYEVAFFSISIHVPSFYLFSFFFLIPFVFWFLLFLVFICSFLSEFFNSLFLVMIFVHIHVFTSFPEASEHGCKNCGTCFHALLPKPNGQHHCTVRREHYETTWPLLSTLLQDKSKLTKFTCIGWEPKWDAIKHRHGA